MKTQVSVRPAVAAVASVVAAVGIGALALSAQAPPRDDETPVVFRATTELVQFDAVVVDTDGRPVGTLTADDFEIRQDGQLVELRDVTFIDRTARLRRLEARRVGDEDVVPRAGIDVDTLVVLIDDMTMTPDGFERVRHGLRQFFATLPVGIEAGVLRTGETGRRSTVLTADREDLTARIDGLRYLARSARGGAARSGAASPGHRDLERTFVDGTLGSLNSLLVSLRSLPGRKTVILLSEGIALQIGTGIMGEAVIGSTQAGTDENHWLAQPIEGRLQRLAQLAADAGVVVHAVDVRGVPADGAGNLAEWVNMRDGMTTLAARMGGVYFGFANDLTQPLKRIAEFEQGYYLLSYVPPGGTFVDHEPAPFRRLTVSLRDDALRVLTRPGFFGRR